MNNKQIINFKTDGKRITISTLDSIHHVQFSFDIKQVENFGDMLVVRLKVSIGNTYNENIFGVSDDAKILWQVEKIEHVDRDSPYTGIGEENGLLSAYNWDGFDYLIDPKTGRILDKKFVK